MSGPLFSAIVAADPHWGIGRNGELLLPLPPDLKRFRALTLGHTVVMGRRTFLSLPGRKALPGRRNIVLTHWADAVCPGAELCPSVETLLGGGVLRGAEEVFVIGGAQVYAQLLPHCARAYVTRIEADLSPADCFFPDLDAAPGWRLDEVSPAEGWEDVTFRYALYVNETFLK
ncbi:MAG: dihydrofolate reductase [Oscillospiraceae bacterium]|nr:dihydrofolate reductase [Oscillospiraceae bacterium]